MRDAAIDTHRSPVRGAGRSRGAGAPALDDMVGEGPVSRGAPRRGGITSAAVAAQRLGGGRSAAAASRGRRGPGFAARLRACLPRIRPLKALTIGAFGVALVGIVANAMVFQRGHHPSPLFGLGRSVDGTADATQRTAAAVPAPAIPAPVEKTGTIPPPAAAPVDPAPPAAAAAPKPAPVHHAAKVHHEQAAAAKPATAAAAGHPRPGHPAPAHAKAETKPAETKSAETKAEKAEARPDPVAKFLAGGAHAAKPESKPVAAAAKPASKPDVKPVAAAATAHAGKVAAAPAARPHHRLAATAPAEGAKPAAKSE